MGRGVEVGCDLPFAMTCQVYLCFLTIDLCKAGRGLFWGSILKSATCLSKGGSHFSVSRKFQYSHQMVGVRFSSKLR